MCLCPGVSDEINKHRRPRQGEDPIPVDSRFRGNDSSCLLTPDFFIS